MGFVTTHVLDTASGIPASNMQLELWEHTEEGVVMITTGATNNDGRMDAPIITEADMRTGRFELRFHVADYFKASGAELPEPAFLDIVPIVFGISDAESHYHIPLLVSPYGYSTYRGS